MTRPVYTLGINTSHDRAACLAKDGEIVAFIAEERLDRKKHSVEPDLNGNYLAMLPRRALRYCLDLAGIELNDLDRILVSSSVVYHPQRRLRNLTLDDVLPQLPGLRDASRVALVNHHLAHGAGAYYASPFTEAAVMVVDGGGNVVGSWDGGRFTMPPVEHTTYYRGEGTRIVELAKTTARPKSLNSLGALYHLVTTFIGFGQFNEGKTMGLAPFGGSSLVAAFENAVRVSPDGAYEIDPDFQPFDWRGRVLKPAFLKRFGPPRREGQEVRQVDKDMAFAVQHVLEETLIAMARALQKKTGAKNLCIGGGVGLNSVANKKILDRTDFEEIFIIPCAADDGCALGGALLAWHEREGAAKRYTMRHAYLGRTYAETEVLAAIEENKDWVRWRRSDDVAAETAKLLAAGAIVGWHQGGAEAGPRALGHRSILCDSRRREMVDILNAKVKHREGFRPFAPVVPLERAPEFFDLTAASPFMLLIAKVKAPDLVPAITHVDGTGRIQTVTREENGRFYDLVLAFEKETGVPVILNTSFNIAGDPLVETPRDAIECFLQTRIDVLVVEDYVIEKKDLALAHTISDLRKQVRAQEAKIAAMEQELESIRRSRGWRLLGTFNRLRGLVGLRRRDIDFM
jgi:carbamoyltransferase